ncbi:MAG TPA: hypothetical protein VJ180_07465 [Pyrinomonadaceae bacterium]|nr:hypothetical protein [Pyrinomonadaceae bacterium]
MQKAMNFLIEQQAQTAVKLDTLAEKVDALTDRVDSLAVLQGRAEKKWERTEEGIRALLSIAELHEREIVTLGQQISTVSETTRATDERLNALINIVERHITEGRNGKP